MASVTFDKALPVLPWLDEAGGRRTPPAQPQDGEFPVPSGPLRLWKSTSLRIACRSEEVNDGNILIGDHRNVTDVPPKDRDTRWCSRNYALLRT
jgi:ABC-type sugar transport system ATPase subunit